jgi:hypothetical protein
MFNEIVLVVALVALGALMFIGFHKIGKNER